MNYFREINKVISYLIHLPYKPFEEEKNGKKVETTLFSKFNDKINSIFDMAKNDLLVKKFNQIAEDAKGNAE